MKLCSYGCGQKILEEDGWKVLNYYPLPTEEQLLEDIKCLVSIR